MKTVQIAVVGAGPAGLATALSISALGAEAALLAPAFDPIRAAADTRTTALLASSVTLLEKLGVWEACRAQASPLTAIRIIDDRGGLLRAPEVLFRASELGLDSFGANIANANLNAALDAAAASSPRLLRIVTSAVSQVTPGETSVRLDLTEGGSLESALVIAADGRNSLVRARAGIGVHAWQYPQSAIAATFDHARPHHGVTTELHGRSGPLTTVPLLAGSSLVWVEAPTEAERIGGLGDAAFLELLEQRLHSMLGPLHAPSPRVVFPLSGLSAECMGRNRVALVGEAAHVIPPIGAQGLNLGLRDACVLAECIAEARGRGQDIGGPDMLLAYHKARQADVLARTAAVDALNRSLLADFLPLQALRGVGLHALANLPSLRRLIMQGGLAPAGPLPHLMRPGALRP